MTFAQKLLQDKSSGKLPTAAFSSDPVSRAMSMPVAFRRAVLLLVVCLGLFANVARAQVMGITKPFDPANFPSGPNPASSALGPIGETVVTGNGIEYHGGPVMLGPHNVYFIWYGNFSGNIALTMLPDLINGFGGSRYFNTNTTYGDATGNIVNTVTMAGSFFDNYSQGKALNGNSLAAVVSAPLNAGAFPVDSNGIYFVLTSPDVTLNSLPNPAAAPRAFVLLSADFIPFGTFGTTDLKVAFIGDPATQCPARPGQLGLFRRNPSVPMEMKVLTPWPV